MTTYNFTKSLHLYVFNVRKKTHKLIFLILFKTMCQHLFFSQEALQGFLDSLWSSLCFERALWLVLSSSFSQIKKQDMEGTHSSPYTLPCQQVGLELRFITNKLLSSCPFRAGRCQMWPVPGPAHLTLALQEILSTGY